MNEKGIINHMKEEIKGKKENEKEENHPGLKKKRKLKRKEKSA